MNLECGEEMLRRHADRRGHQPAVFVHARRIVLRAEAAVQAAIDAVGDAALAAEKSVTQARSGGQQRRLQHHGCWSSAARSWPADGPTSCPMCGSETPIPWNIAPMPRRPPPISRFSASETVSDT